MTTPITARFELPAEPAALLEMLLNPEFRAVSVTRSSGQAIAKSTHDVEIPLVGINLTVDQTEVWNTETFVAQLELTAPGYPAHGTGTLRLNPGTGSTTVELDAELTVNVPLIGRRVEAKTAEEFGHIIADIESRARVWLAR